MAADPESVQAKADELRSVAFNDARRGFDRDEVLAYLSRLADWLENVDLADPDAVRRELAFVGEQTSEILTKAEEAAREIREEAQRNAAELLGSARADAKQLRADAEADAERMTDESLERRRALETVIGDLVARRDEVVNQLSRIADDVGEVVDNNLEEDDTGEEPQAADDEQLDPDTEEQAQQSAQG